MHALWSWIRALLRGIGSRLAQIVTRRSPYSRGGRWDPVFDLPNVAIHTSVRPDGKVLFWGRRDDPAGSLNEHAGTPHVWDPATRACAPTPLPRRADGSTVNLFCAGHAYLPDGRLLVAGGHVSDGDGIDYAGTYDHRSDTWTPLPVMNGGRWYPTALTLADGRVLVMSGSAAAHGTIAVNAVSQITDGQSWRSTVDFVGLPLYPRLHVAPDGRVLMAGSNAMTYLLDTRGDGAWTPLAARANGAREYGSSAMYAPGQVIYVGGGNDAGSDLPTANAEVIDLTAATPTWRPATPMHFRRRQHNATLLPDGTVLVTGGTAGPGFNDVSPGRPVHVPEVWDPATDTWTQLAAEAVDRCYHATAVLLPDATVLSAGGGEFMVGPEPNAPADNHRTAQVFHPPYLFRGRRPRITAAPSELTAGEAFTVKVRGPRVARMTLLRLASVTHAFDMNQRCIPVPCTGKGRTLTATLPAAPGVCVPGHYMLFTLTAAGVPSVAAIVRITATTDGTDGPAAQAFTAGGPPAPLVAADAPGTRVTVGLTAQCPYGLAACWGGAYEALTALGGVVAVTPYADAEDSTAEVVLAADTALPDLDAWPDQLARSANGSYAFRGVELTVDGTVERRGADLVLVGGARPPIRLRPLEQVLAWDLTARAPRPATAEEQAAYERVADRVGGHVRVTGPVTHADADWSLAVRVLSD